MLRAGDQVRITAQVIQAATDTHLWANSYDRRLSDILSLQKELAQDIARQVMVTVSPADRPETPSVAPTIDPAAYEAYLRGRFYADRMSPESIEQASKWFKKAIARDPTSALAHAGLAYYYIIRALYTEMSPQVVQHAEAAARKALESDDTLIEAHVALVFVDLFFHWNPEAAQRRALQAQNLNPNNADVHRVLAFVHLAQHCLDEALAEMRRAIALDPFSPLCNTELGIFLLFQGQANRAIEQFQTVLELDPNYWRAYWYLAVALAAQSQYHEAITMLREAIRKFGDIPILRTELAGVYAATGEGDEALAILQDLEKMSEEIYAPSYFIASVHTALGNVDEAFDWLEKGLQERSAWMVFLKAASRWRFARLRSDPRFTDLLRRVGFEP